MGLTPPNTRIALAAIKELYKHNKQLQAAIEGLTRRVETLEGR